MSGRSLALAALAALAAALPAAESPVRDAAAIPESSYVRVDRDGHLELEGRRVRYWGWIGHIWLEGKLAEHKVKPGDPPEVVQAKVAKARRVFDALAQRIHDSGFNLVRWWGDVDWTKPYTPGDGSPADLMAFSLAALGQRGIKVWMTAFNDLGQVTPEDVAIVDDPATAEAWVAGVQELQKAKRTKLRGQPIMGWDARSQAVALRRMRQIADWPNHYKGGLRLGDDPQMAVWELSNEEWWFAHMAKGDWQKQPKVFRDALQARWTAFLAKKYGDDVALAKAWLFLLPGESLAQGTVLLAPLASPSDGKAVNDANPAALAALTAGKQAFTRDDFTRARGADVIEFLVETLIAYKTSFRDAAKGMGRSLALSPLVLDTGDGFRIQAVWLHQHGDASTMCSYLWQVANDRQQPRFPFVSGLEEPPRLAMGIPWAEVGKIPGKPFFIYEFQTNNPDKYRAEVPFRIATLAAANDWDIVNWHIFGRPNDPDETEPYGNKAMNYSHKDVSIEGVHWKHDEVHSAALKTAGHLFTSGALTPIAKPTVMTFGRKSLFDPKSADYGGSFGDLGAKIAPTAHRFGLHMRVDPTQEKDSVDGRTVERGLMEACPIRLTDQLEFDWQRGHLKVDAPAAVSYTGFFAKHGGPARFANGITLDAVRVVNPPDMPYPVGEDERYVSFAVVAEDGKPLAETRKAVLSLVSTSFNWGFRLNHDNVARGDLDYTGKAFEGMQLPKPPPGAPAVLIARVGATIGAGPLRGMRYRLLDFHFRELGAGTVGESLAIDPAQPVFIVELTR